MTYYIYLPLKEINQPFCHVKYPPFVTNNLIIIDVLELNLNNLCGDQLFYKHYYLSTH